jgi:hypothetical protein
MVRLIAGRIGCQTIEAYPGSPEPDPRQSYGDTFRENTELLALPSESVISIRR